MIYYGIQYVTKKLKLHWKCTETPQYGKNAKPHLYWKEGDFYKAWCGDNNIITYTDINEAFRRNAWGRSAYIVSIVYED